MLKVSLHFSTPSTASAENVLGRLDIGYAKLDAKADYKVVMFTSGTGEHKPVQVRDYPRWSASVWDLVARAVCQSLYNAEMIPDTCTVRLGKCAFIDNMTAIIEHWPDGLDVRRSTIGTAHIQMTRRRGQYRATFETDFEGKQSEEEVFWYRPKVMNPWDLLVRGYAWTAHQRLEMPARPMLYKPIPFAEGNRSLVSLDTLNEPAYSGILKWLHNHGLPMQPSSLVDGPCVTEQHFVRFLRTAV